MAKIFSTQFHKGSLIDSVSKTAGTLTAGNGGFRKTEKGQAMLFDGSTTTLGYGTIANWEMGNYYTIVAWVKPKIGTGNSCIITMTKLSVPYNGWEMYVNKENGAVGRYNGAVFSYSSVYKTEFNKWNFITIEGFKDSSNGYVKVSINNNPKETIFSGNTSVLLSLESSYPINIGSFAQANHYNNGSVAKVEGYNTLLSQSEINNLYQEFLNSYGTEKPIRNFQFPGIKKYYSFDGVDDYISIPDDDAIDFGTGDFTLVSKFNNETLSTNRSIINKRDVGNAGPGWNLFLNTGNQVTFLYDDNAINNATILTFTGVTISADIDYVLFVKIDDTAVTAYLYNCSTESGTALTPSGALNTRATCNNSTYLRVGAISASLYQFDGTISDVYLFNYAVSSDKIALWSRQIADGTFHLPAEDKGADNSELISGGDFESGLIGSKSDGSGSVSTWSINTTSPISGVQDARLIITTSFAGRPYINFSKTPVVGKRYLFSFDYKVNSGSMIVYQLFNNGTIYINQTLTGSGTFTYESTCLSTSAYMTIYAGNSICDVQIDNVSLVQLGSTLSLSPEGMYNTAWRDFDHDVSYPITLGSPKLCNLPDGSFFNVPVLLEDFSNNPVGETKPREWVKGTGSYKIDELTSQDSVLNHLDIGTKYLENTSAGTIATQSKTAYGVWEFDLYKGADGNSLRVSPIGGNKSYPSNQGYHFYIFNTEALYFDKEATNLFKTANSYIANNTWYRIKVARLNSAGTFAKIVPSMTTEYPADTFAVFIKGGAFGNNWTLVNTTGGSGSNPVTNSTYTTSNYFVCYLDSGDRIGNIVIKEDVEQ